MMSRSRLLPMGVGDVGGSGLSTDSTGTGGILVGSPRSLSLSLSLFVSLSSSLLALSHVYRRFLAFGAVVQLAVIARRGGRCGSHSRTEQRERRISPSPLSPLPLALFSDARSLVGHPRHVLGQTLKGETTCMLKFNF